MRFVTYGDRKAVAALLRPMYNTGAEDATLTALATFADSNLSTTFPGERRDLGARLRPVHPFLAFGQGLHKVIRTTNSSESPYYKCRRIFKNRCRLPHHGAAVKLLWPVIMIIGNTLARLRARGRAPTRSRTATQAPAAHLAEGAVTQGWEGVQSELVLAYRERVTAYL